MPHYSGHTQASFSAKRIMPPLYFNHTQISFSDKQRTEGLANTSKVVLVRRNVGAPIRMLWNFLTCMLWFKFCQALGMLIYTHQLAPSENSNILIEATTSFVAFTASGNQISDARDVFLTRHCKRPLIFRARVH